MSLSLGTRLGPYEIVSPIGAGGMGEVYRARDPRLGRDVAVKIVAGSGARDADRVRRFEREARAVATLEHPHILAVHDVGTHEGQAYVVFELLEGESLRERLARGPLPVRKSVELAMQVCQGLAAAHAHGIVHRDFKPGNLFLTRDGRIKILDFGLAKLVEPQGPRGDEAATPTATEVGARLGTPGYASPEQVRGEHVDPRSDLFALGAVLYEMVTGQRAFQGATPADALSAVLSHDPPAMGAAGGPVPASLERVVRRCLEKDPEERFQSARDVPIGAGLPHRVELGAVRASRAAWVPPGGSRVVVFGGEDKGRPRFWLVDRAGGRPRPIGPEMQVVPPGDATGERFVATSLARGSVTLIPLDGGPLREIRGVPEPLVPSAFSADGRSLFLANSQYWPCEIHRLDLATERVELFRRISPVERTGLIRCNSIVPSADGRGYAYRYYRVQNDVVLAEGLR